MYEYTYLHGQSTAHVWINTIENPLGMGTSPIKTGTHA